MSGAGVIVQAFHFRRTGDIAMNDQASTSTTPTTSPSAKPSWYRRTWVIALTAGLSGLGVGAASAGGADVTKTSEYQAVAKQRDDAKASLSTKNDELSKARADLTTLAGDLPEREAAVTKKEADLGSREVDVKAREAAVKKRENAVSKTEQLIEDNTIGGDGVYEVGADIKAGTYKTKGSTGCYYAILNSSDTSDIADNNNIDGPATVTVRNGQFLELSGCDDWVLQP